MKRYANGTLLIEHRSELPCLHNATNLYLDFETTSGSQKLMSTNPWHNCQILGIAIAVDESPIYYVPVKHKELQVDCLDWLCSVVASSEKWINHNIKYDAHVLCNDDFVSDMSLRLPQLIDTLALAKLIDSDRRFKPGGYTLSALSKEWLNEDISGYEKDFEPYLKSAKGVTFNRDYGEIPLHLLAPYAGQDVNTVKKLSQYIKDKLPPESYDIAAIEIKVTKALFDMERHGVRTQPNQLRLQEADTLMGLMCLINKLEKLVGFAFNPSSPKDIYDVLINTYGLPVLETTDKGNPTFSKNVLKEYELLPEAPTEVISGIQEYRKLDLFLSMYIKRYQELQVNDYLHPDFNQTVATGRMSCRDPNAQQLNKKAKKLIVPPDGHSFISVDYSQIEFRLIVHLIQNKKAIAAYAKDKDTDFHDWVQSVLPGNVTRARAKTTNFAMGYGTGRKALAKNMALMENLRDQSINRTHFQSMCRQQANEIYDQYHGTFPEIKNISKKLENQARTNGYITNLYGRRRYLPPSHCHTAFNSWCQSTAADIMKDRLAAVADLCESSCIYPVLAVHDEILFTAPTDIANDIDVVKAIVECMETPDRLDQLSVPIRCSIGRSAISWADCADEEFTV